jgi:pimeloyl-ACP methyl ester carboxylesterase
MSQVPGERMPFCDPLVQWSLALLAGGPVVTPRMVKQHLREIPDFVRLFKYSILPLLPTHHVAAGTITAAALVIVGARDRFVSVREAEALVAALPAARELVVIPGGEHFLTYASADVVATHLHHFLETTP